MAGPRLTRRLTDRNRGNISVETQTAHKLLETAKEEHEDAQPKL